MEKMLNSFYKLTLPIGVFYVDSTALIYEDEEFCVPFRSKSIIINNRKYEILSVDFEKYSPCEAQQIRKSPQYLGEKDFVGKFTYGNFCPNLVHIKCN